MVKLRFRKFKTATNKRLTTTFLSGGNQKYRMFSLLGNICVVCSDFLISHMFHSIWVQLTITRIAEQPNLPSMNLEKTSRRVNCLLILDLSHLYLVAQGMCPRFVSFCNLKMLLDIAC